MKAADAELRDEIHQIKRRVASLEKAFDSMLSKDDAAAIEEAHKDLSGGRAVELSRVKKKRS